MSSTIELSGETTPNHLGRVLGFVAFPKLGTGFSEHRVISTMETISSSFNLHLSWHELHSFKVGLVTRSAMSSGLPKASDRIGFAVSSATSQSIDSDRFLKVVLCGDTISCESDYAGTVPYYYSKTGSLVISNFMAIVEAAIGVSEYEIDFAALYAFVKFGHNLWDETVYTNVGAGTPSSKSLFGATVTLHPSSTIWNSSFLPTLDSEPSFQLEKKLLELRDLNTDLVKESLRGSQQVVLPLSSGLDSRLVLAGISEDKKLRDRTLAVTYGPHQSIEVKSAKRLAEESGVRWAHINLPLNFLSDKYLSGTSLIFGTSMHMHAMYQMEFTSELRRRKLIDSDAVFTSGFMTGVPTGQHVSKLGHRKTELDPKVFLGSFSQSQYWSRKELQNLFGNYSYSGDELVSQKLRSVPTVYSSNPYKQSILLDIWTRQRNFISYHPRTLELSHSVASPHMRVEWPTFFFDLPNSWLWKRRMVQEFFLKHYPRLAAIPTNSENFSKLGSPIQSLGRVAHIVLDRLGFAEVVPERLRDQQLRFDETALSKSLPNSLAPLPDFIPPGVNADPIHKALINLHKSSGTDVRAYGKLVSWQTVARSLEINTR